LEEARSDGEGTLPCSTFIYDAEVWRGRKIVRESVVNKLLILIKKLLETPSQRIFKRGFERAVWLIRKTAIKSGVLAQKSGLHILAWNCVVVRIRREDRRAGMKQLRC